MPHLDQIPPENMAEVISVANRMFEAERDAAQERQSTVDAAAELDIPAEYLERAAAEVQQQLIAQAKQKRRKRQTIIATVALASVLTGGWVATHRPAPAPTSYTFSNAADLNWGLNTSPGSQATLTYPTVPGHGTVADINVKTFQPSKGTGEYFVNLDTHKTPSNLSGYKTVTVKARATGLGYFRVSLENGEERWRTQPLPLTSDWRTYPIELKTLDHQKRAGSGTGWRSQGTGSPNTAGRLSFKLGQNTNEPTATGNVQIESVKFE